MGNGTQTSTAKTCIHVGVPLAAVLVLMSLLLASPAMAAPKKASPSVAKSTAAQLGKKKSNRGKIGWAKFAPRLNSTSTFRADGAVSGWTMLDVPPAKAETFEKGVLYRTPDFTVTQLVTGTTVKEMLQVNRRMGKKTWRWQLLGPANLAPSGAVTLAGDMSIEPPFLLDGTGKRLATKVRWKLSKKDVLSLTLDDRTLPLPYIIDPNLDNSAPEFGLTSLTENPGCDPYTWKNPSPPVGQNPTIYYNPNQACNFTVETMALDNDTGISRVRFPDLNGTGWTPVGGALDIATGTPGAQGLLGTYWDTDLTGSDTDAGYRCPNNAWPACYPSNGAVPLYPNGTRYSRTDNSAEPVPVTAPCTSATVFCFSWNTAPPYPQLEQDTFSARWTGYFVPPDSGVYHFQTYSDDGIRVLIDNNAGPAVNFQEVVRVWNDHAPAVHTGGVAGGGPGAGCQGGINLTAGVPYPIRVEFYENGGNAYSSLRWRRPTAGAALQTPTGCNSPMAGQHLLNSGWTGGGSTTFPEVPWTAFRTPNAYNLTYDWAANASTPAGAKTITAVNGDDPSFEDTATANFEVVADAVGPTGSAANLNQPNTPTIATNTAGPAITYSEAGITDPAPDATGVRPDAGASIQRRSRSLVNGSCTGTWSGWSEVASPGATSGTFTDSLTTAGCYQWSLKMSDNVSNSSYITDGDTYKFDQTVPAMSFVGYAESVQLAYQHTIGTTHYYNPSAPAGLEFLVTMSANDDHAGMDRVVFPMFGPNWTGGGTVPGSGPTYTATYRLVAPLAGVAPGLTGATAYDNVAPTANFSPQAFTVLEDGVAPSTGTVNHPNTWTSTSFNVNSTFGTDAGVGVRDSRLRMRTGTWNVGTASCGGWSSWLPHPTAPLNPSVFTETALVSGQCYQYGAVTTDNVNNVSPQYQSASQTKVDLVAPLAPATVNDGVGADIDAQPSTTTINANWPAAVDAHSGISKYDYCISTAADCGGTVVVNWTANGAGTTLTRTGLSLIDMTTYFVAIRATDLAGNLGPTTTSDGILVDIGPPPAPALVNDGLIPPDADYTASNSSLGGNWSSVFDGSGINRYEYCITTSATGSDCSAGAVRTYTSAGVITSTTASGLTLSNGTMYYWFVRAVDSAGNIGGSARSDGITVDLSAPSVTTVADGAAADIDLQNPITALWANWAASTDSLSGLLRYELCFTTSITGSDCALAAVSPWASTATATSGTRAGLTLFGSTTYYSCVRAIDNAGNTSAAWCSDGLMVDGTPPPAVAPVNDGVGADIDITADATQVSANWTSVTDASGINRYDYCITLNSAGTNCAGGAIVTWATNGVSTFVTRTGLSLANGSTYYVCVRAVDNALLTGAISCSDGQIVDIGPPNAPTPVEDGTAADIDQQASGNTISASWGAATDPTGINRYEYCITLTSTGSDCAGAATVPWTSNLLSLSLTRSGLLLTSGSTYYVCISAVDNAANASAPGCSDGVLVDTVAPLAAASANDGSGADIDWQSSLAQITGNWTAEVDPAVGTGVAYREICITTNAAATDCSGGAILTWTSNGLATTTTRSGLTLTNGSTYYLAVRAVDAVGNLGTIRVTDGVTVDTVAPVTSASVADGPGTDIDFQSSLTAMDATWSPVTDAGSGLARYEYCITTNSAGTNCAGAATVPWTTNALSTTLTRTGLSLANGVKYFVCARGVDRAGNVAVTACSDGVTTDAGPPPAPAPVNDGSGADVDYWNSASSIDANWATVTDPSGINRYEYCISTSSSGADCAGGAVVNWTSNGASTSVTRTGLALTNGNTYYVCAVAVDNGLNFSPSSCSDGMMIDTTSPPIPASVQDGSAADIDWQTSLTTLLANWSGVVDLPSGVLRYEYCISLTAGAPDCATVALVPWTSAGSSTTLSRTGLSLANLATYHIAVRAVDRAGNVSARRVSDGVGIDITPPPTPTGLNDGMASDVDITNSASTLEANWGSVTDTGSGLSHYQVCLTTISLGANCATTAISPWTGNGTTTSVSRSGLALVNNTRYYACVRAVDGAGNNGAVTCSDGIDVDLGPPPAPTTVSDGAGADIDISSNNSSYPANWSTVVDPSGISRYEYCVTTTLTGADCTTTATVTWSSNGTSTSVNYVVGLANGSQYRICVRAVDNGANTGSQTCSDGLLVDSASPGFPAVVRDGTAADIQWQTSLSSIAANWDAAADSESAISGYQYCITNLAFATDCAAGALVTWTPTAGTSISRAGLALTNATVYFVAVRAIDSAGNIGIPQISNGRTTDASPPATLPSVSDGSGADIDAQSSTSTLDANWPSATDMYSGVARYDYCISTLATGTNCATTATVPWTANGLSTIFTRAGLTLTNTVRYYTCVRTADTAGNLSGTRCSDGVTIDNGPPPAPGGVIDGTTVDVDFISSLTSLSGRWSAVTDPSGINRYEYCISTSASGADCAGGAELVWTASGSALTFTQPALSLTDGVEYYVCSRAVDNGLNISAAGCSDGATVDTTAPNPPSAVRDSLGADIDWQTSLTSASANWVTGSDLVSGISTHEYCVTTSALAADCAAGAVATWTSVGPSSVTRSGLALTQGTLYRMAIRAVDGAGNVSTAAISDGFTPDNTAPSAVTPITDGPGADVDFTASTSSFQASWSSATDAVSGLQRYEYCITTSSTGTNCAGAATVPWTANASATTVNHTGLTLVHATRYFACVRAVDQAGNTTPTACSDGALVDTLAPTPPATVRDGLVTDAAYTTSTSQLDGSWTAATDPSGINHYEYCITTLPGGADCAGAAIASWSANGTSLSVSRGGLTLSNGSTYYACVIAFDNSLNSSAAACSNGITVDTTAPSAPASVNDGTAADIDWQRATTALSANWPSVIDPISGTSGYQYCITTDSLGANCAGGALVAWTNTPAATVTRAALTLPHGTMYYVAVRARDTAGNTGAATISDGVRIDTAAPGAPASASDGLGADIDVIATTSTFSGNWPAGTDALSGVARYDYCITTSNIGANCATTAPVKWTANPTTSVTRAGLTLVANTRYFICVRTVDNAANTSAARCSDGAIVDIGPPLAPASVKDGLGADIDVTGSTSILQTSWTAVTDPTGINHYDYCITTISTGTDCSAGATVPWTSSGTAISRTTTGLTLTSGVTYYVGIRAVDGGLNIGLPRFSDGITVDATPPSAPATLIDGATGPDAAWTASLSTLSARWGLATDTSGIAAYQYCFSTSTTGADCGAGALAPWTSTASTTITRSGLSLTPNVTYYAHVRATDTVGNVGSAIASTGITVDTSGPTGIAIVTPADTGSAPEDYMTFTWESGTDSQSGLATYDIFIDGTLRASNLATTTWGAPPVYAGAHSWMIRARDAVGNTRDFAFTFTATPVPDVTGPSSFNLLSPADGASTSIGDNLTWEPASDFHGVANYEIYFDSALVATVPGAQTYYTLTGGGGLPICTSDFDPTINTPGCLFGASYSAPWNLGSHTGHNNDGTSLGLDDFDGNMQVAQMSYQVTVPAAGADLRFSHYYDNQASYTADGKLNSAWDGGTVEISTNGGSTWQSTCVVGAKAKYGASISCGQEIMEPAGGYNAVLASGTGNPLAHRHVFGGSSGSMTLSRLQLSSFAGQTILIRFRQGNDSCYVGMPAAAQAYCPSTPKAANWHIDDIELATSVLSPGMHAWQVRAVDPSGNGTYSNQTWNFNFS